jgi:ADP-heptose:LPS heptosyltransferase
VIPAAAIKERLHGRRFAIISTHSNHRRKNWPLERFEELTRWLAEERDISCLFTGTRKNGELLSFCSDDDARRLNGAGLKFSETLELLPSAALTIGNDSALGHYAGLHHIPSLILFSAAHSLPLWAPQQGRFICLQAQVPCRLCSFRIRGCDHDYLCMKAITVAMAKQACDQLLQPE